MLKRRPLQKYTTGNKRLQSTNLHGERYYDWFDKTFNLPSLAEGSTKQGSTPDKLIPVSFRGKRFSLQGIAVGTTFSCPNSCRPCTHHIQSEHSGAIDIPHHRNRNATTGYSLGEGLDVPSPSSNSYIIDSEADKTVFSKPYPHSLRFGDYSSSIPIIHDAKLIARCFCTTEPLSINA